MSQVIFTTATTKGQALTGINANFTELYGRATFNPSDLALTGPITFNGVSGIAPVGNGLLRVTDGADGLGVLNASDFQINGMSVDAAIDGSIATAAAAQTTANEKIGGSTENTDNAILRANGTGGSTLQGSSVIIDDSGNIDTPGKLRVGGLSEFLSGIGSPEGVVSASPGSIYLNGLGGPGSALWVKEGTDTPSTGWIAK